MKWTPVGIDPSDAEHAQYLAEVKEFFIEGIKRLFDLHLRMKRPQSGSLLVEIMQQSRIVQRKARCFCGRQELLSEIREKLMLEFGQDSDKIEKLERAITELDTKEEKTTEVEREHLKIAQNLRESGVKYALEPRPPNTERHERSILQMAKIERYKKPIIIHGESGSGKTSLMAYITTQIDEWLSPLKPVKIVRFLGTSPQTTAIRQAMAGILQQIWIAYEIEPPFDVNRVNDFSFLSVYFRSLLGSLDTKSKPLVLILDSVDQLSPHDHAYNLNWLPVELPQGIYLVVSTLPHIHNCLKNMMKKLPDDSRFVEIGDLDVSTAENLVDDWLEWSHRAVTDPQKHVITTRFKECPLPLFLMVSAQEALLWKSYTQIDECLIGTDTVSGIQILFDRLEEKHGAILLGRALGRYH